MVLLPLTTPTGKITTALDGQLPPGRGSQTEFANHWTPMPLAAGVGSTVIGPVTSGRSVARPVNEFAFAAVANTTLFAFVFAPTRSEEHTSELSSRGLISY